MTLTDRDDGDMSRKTKTRADSVRVTLPTGQPLRTSQDTAYAWVSRAGTTGWTRINTDRPHQDAYRLLIPKRYNRSLAAAALDATPHVLETELPVGLVLLPPAGTHESVDLLVKFREAGKAHSIPDTVNASPVREWPFFLARASTQDVLTLISQHDLNLAAIAISLRSIPAMEDLLQRLGHVRVQKMLDSCDLNEELTWKIMRSPAYDPVGLHTDRQLIGAAGNPRMLPGDQARAIRVLVRRHREGDEMVEAPLTRILASEGLAAEAAEVAASHLEELPVRSVMALANNTSATWPWLRRQLDVFPDPEVVLASLRIGELSRSRRALATHNLDPIVRRDILDQVTDAAWCADDPKANRVLSMLSHNVAAHPWTVRSPLVDPEDWGVASVARQWAARAADFPEAEKLLRRAVDLHNSGWGAAKPGQSDPDKAASSETARMLSRFDPVLEFLELDHVGQSISLEQARVEAVRAAVAHEAMGQGVNEAVEPLMDAALAGVAAEAAA